MARRDELYEEAAAEFGPAFERLARGYEADPEKCRDLLQEIHVALWRSFEKFDGRCYLRTWVYRVAHNRAVSHVRRNRANAPLPDLDEVESHSGRIEQKVRKKKGSPRFMNFGEDS